MRLVLDSNIYLSAYLSKGLASKILELGQLGKIDIFISEEIRSEVHEKLISKFKADGSDIERHLSILRQATQDVLTFEKVTVVSDDPDDNIILECAKAAGADLIVTSDKHLLKLKRFEQTAIVHPKTLVWIIPEFLGSL